MNKGIYLAIILSAAAITACSTAKPGVQEPTDKVETELTETELTKIELIETESTAAQAEQPLEEVSSGGIAERIDGNQTFEVSLNDWGEVRFTTCNPVQGEGLCDVEFYLRKDGEIIYTFPEYWKDNKSTYYFNQVDMVSFKDVNKDGRDDVIVIASYETGAGSQGMVPFHVSRIYLADGKGFVLDRELSEAIDKNQANDNIETVMAYINEEEKQDTEEAADQMYQVLGIHERDARSFVTEFLKRVQADDREAVAGMIAYPRKIVMPDQEVIVQNDQEFLPWYDVVFTKEFKELLAGDANTRDDIFWNYMGFSIGSGKVWFNEIEGTLKVITINKGDEGTVIYPGETGIQPG